METLTPTDHSSPMSAGSRSYRSALVLPRGFPELPNGWITQTENVSTAPGVDIFLARHQAPSSNKRNKRTLLVVHGLGEHGGRYYHFPHYLAKTFDEIVCMDQRGHGRSSGIRGHVQSFDDLPGDVAAVARHLLGQESTPPQLHLFGHSLGGHVVLRTLIRHADLPLASTTISAPFLGIAAPVPAVKKAAAQVLSYVWGTLQLDTEVDAHGLSHDPAVAEAYTSDRLVHSKMTPAFFRSMMTAMIATLGTREGIRSPVLFQVPLQDKLVRSDLTLEFFGNLQHPQKRLKTYPNLFHEIFNETDREQVFSDFQAWVEANSGGARA